MKPVQSKTATYAISILEFWIEKNMLLLNPPYSRGFDWPLRKQQCLIWSIIYNIPIGTIIINDRMLADWQDDNDDDNDDSGQLISVIDGRRRILALLAFMRNELTIPKKWFSDDMVDSPKLNVSWDDLTNFGRVRFRNFELHCTVLSVPFLNIEHEIYEAINHSNILQYQISTNPGIEQ